MRPRLAAGIADPLVHRRRGLQEELELHPAQRWAWIGSTHRFVDPVHENALNGPLVYSIKHVRIKTARTFGLRGSCWKYALEPTGFDPLVGSDGFDPLWCKSSNGPQML
jgi:hypothetical protein